MGTKQNLLLVCLTMMLCFACEKSEVLAPSELEAITETTTQLGDNGDLAGKKYSAPSAPLIPLVSLTEELDCYTGVSYMISVDHIKLGDEQMGEVDLLLRVGYTGWPAIWNPDEIQAESIDWTITYGGVNTQYSGNNQVIHIKDEKDNGFGIYTITVNADLENGSTISQSFNVLATSNCLYNPTDSNGSYEMINPGCFSMGVSSPTSSTPTSFSEDAPSAEPEVLKASVVFVDI